MPACSWDQGESSHCNRETISLCVRGALSYAVRHDRKPAGKNLPPTFQRDCAALSGPCCLPTENPGRFRQISYQEVHRRSVGVARALLAKGLECGDRVAILSENRPEWVVTYLGSLMSGGTVVPLDTQLSPAEWRRLLDDSESKWVFVSGTLEARLREAVRDSPLSQRLFCFDTPGEIEGQGSGLERLLDWAHSLDPAPALPEVNRPTLPSSFTPPGPPASPKA